MKTLEIAHRWLTLAYDDVGTGLPVVLLHGFPLDRQMWAPQLGPLSAAGYRVLAPDLPEFGRSTPTSEAFTIERAADVLADVLGMLEISRAVVGGLSMGGYVAMAFARRYHDRLAGLILADTRSEPDDLTARQNRDALISAVKAEGPAAAADAMLPKLLSERTRVTKPEVAETVEQIVLGQSGSGVIAGLYALRDRPDAAPGLLGVGVPTLVLVGEHDAVTPPALAEKLVSRIRGSQLVVIPGAGHMSNLENPEAFNAAVLAFLKKLG
jgi:pimeloyl-ACP methyl ester carboxylesterase